MTQISNFKVGHLWLVTLVFIGTVSCGQQEQMNEDRQKVPVEKMATKKEFADLSKNLNEKVNLSEDEWRERLSPEEFQILRKKGTERAGTGKYNGEKREGTYLCAACTNPLFTSDTKYESGSGWPSFYEAIDGKVEEENDGSLGMARTEILCGRCGGHLGHVFDDGPDPTGLRYCVNSVSINLDKDIEGGKE